MGEHKFQNNVKEYIVFDVRKQQFEKIVGIANNYIVRLMSTNRGGFSLEPDEDAFAVTAHIRNCFAMLNTDGSSPKSRLPTGVA